MAPETTSSAPLLPAVMVMPRFVFKVKLVDAESAPPPESVMLAGVSEGGAPRPASELTRRVPPLTVVVPT